MAYLHVIMKCFPWEMLHDYPEADSFDSRKLTSAKLLRKVNISKAKKDGVSIRYTVLCVFLRSDRLRKAQ